MLGAVFLLHQASLAHLMSGHYYAACANDDATALHHFQLYCNQQLNEPAMCNPNFAVGEMLQCAGAACGVHDMSTAVYWVRQAKALFARVYADEPALFAIAHKDAWRSSPGFWDLIERVPNMVRP